MPSIVCQKVPAQGGEGAHGTVAGGAVGKGQTTPVPYLAVPDSAFGTPFVITESHGGVGGEPRFGSPPTGVWPLVCGTVAGGTVTESQTHAGPKGFRRRAEVVLRLLVSVPALSPLRNPRIISPGLGGQK